MASLSTDKQGNRRILYFAPDARKRRTLYIGKMKQTAADSFLRHFETILACKATNQPFDPSSVQWIATLPDDLADKLADADLIPRRKRNDANRVPTFDQYIPIYLDSKPHIKPTTRRTFEVALRSAACVLGKNRPINVSEREAGTLVKKILDSGYARAYASKCVQVLRGLYRAAIREKLVDFNPFEFVRAGSQVNNGRKKFIEPAAIITLIDTLPTVEWRLIVALARWGGLRTPSEPFALTWDHVLWDKNRLIVPVPKTEHLAGHETRIIPIFPELKPYLDAAWDAAEDGEKYLMPVLRRQTNLSTQLGKYIDRAGLQRWPRIWQNLRASRATELADKFPSHVAAAWLGHTNEIADRHYRSVLDSHFETASALPTQIPTQYDPERGGNGRNAVPPEMAKTLEIQGFREKTANIQLGATGFEPVTSTV